MIDKTVASVADAVAHVSAADQAEERIAFDFEVALPPYADGGVALGLFLGGKRVRNFMVRERRVRIV